MYQKLMGALLFCLLVLFSTGCVTDSKPTEPTVNYKRVSNEVVVHSRAEPDRLSPMLTVSSYSGRIVHKIFAPLVDIDPQETVLKPYLAKALPEVKVVEEGPYAGNNAYTYEIKEAAVWPNGSPVQGSDFLFSLKALFNPLVGSEPYRNALNFLADVQIDPENPRRFTVLTQAPNMNASYYGGWYVYPEYVYDPEGLLKDISLADLTNPEKASALSESNPNLAAFADQFNSDKFSREKGSIVGAGAYEFESWTSGQEIVLKRKQNWWGSKYSGESNLFKAGPEKLIYKFITDDITAVTTLKAEDMDVMTNMPRVQVEELKKSEEFNNTFNLHQGPTLSTGYLGLNNQSPKLEDKRVRQAIAYAINAEEIMKTVTFGASVRSAGPINPVRPYFNKSLKPYTFDIEKAKTLLKEAGWEDSNNNGIVDKEIDGTLTELNIELLVAAQVAVIRDIALIVQSNAKKAGINFELVTKEFNAIRRQHMATREYEAYVLSATADIGLYDPYQNWHTAGATNYAQWGSPETDQLIEGLRGTVDEEKRTALYLELQEIIHDEQPWIFLYSPYQYIAVHKRFDEVEPALARPGIFENQFVLNIK